MVQNVEWDSKFFGFPVGKITVKSNENIEEIIFNSGNFRLVYIFSEVVIKELELALVDKKIIYEKALVADQKVKLIKESKDISSFDSKNHSYDQLLDLAYLSGTYSRFKLDKNIPISYFFRMYKLWLDNSIKKEIAFETLVTTVEEDISGFVTLGKKNSTTSKIGLIAVNGKYQGRNIGSRLISECEILSRDRGFSSIEVATQSDNKAACGLYKKNSFNVKSSEFIYHLWNK